VSLDATLRVLEHRGHRPVTLMIGPDRPPIEQASLHDPLCRRRRRQRDDAFAIGERRGGAGERLDESGDVFAEERPGKPFGDGGIASRRLHEIDQAARRDSFVNRLVQHDELAMDAATIARGQFEPEDSKKSRRQQSTLRADKRGAHPRRPGSPIAIDGGTAPQLAQPHGLEACIFLEVQWRVNDVRIEPYWYPVDWRAVHDGGSDPRFRKRLDQP